MIWRGCIAALLALVLTLVGFAHKPAPGTSAQVQAYVLAGGSFADLCGDTGAPGDLHPGPCNACILSATCALPPATALPLRGTPYVMQPWPLQPAALPASQHTRTAAARAPPFA